MGGAKAWAHTSHDDVETRTILVRMMDVAPHVYSKSSWKQKDRIANNELPVRKRMFCCVVVILFREDDIQDDGIKHRGVDVVVPVSYR